LFWHVFRRHGLRVVIPALEAPRLRRSRLLDLLDLLPRHDR
jgi:hypothetical protein